MGVHATPREHDGLTGRTEAERREIQARIDRLYEAKRRADDGELSIFEAAATLDGGERASEKKCSSCRVKLPKTAEHFYRDAKGYLRAECKVCCRRRSAQGRDREREKARREDPAYREVMRRRSREWRERRRAMGLPIKDTSVRGKLIRRRSNATYRLRQIDDPARRAIYLAYIADCTREIDRMDRREAS